MAISPATATSVPRCRASSRSSAGPTGRPSGRTARTATTSRRASLSSSCSPRSTGRVAERNGNQDAQMAPHGVYRCSDGWVALAIRDDRDRRALAELLGATADDDGIASWTIERRAHEVEELLQARGIPAHEALDSESALR